MNFNIRQITENDFAEIAHWFVDRKWPMPPAHDVAPKLGVIAEKNGIYYACIYSYLTSSSVVYLEWPCLNPNVPMAQSLEAFDEIVTHFKKMSELSEPKVRVLVINTDSEKLAERFKKHGFRIESDYYKATWMLKD